MAIRGVFEARVSKGLPGTAMNWIERETQAGLFVAAIVSVFASLQQRQQALWLCVEVRQYSIGQKR